MASAPAMFALSRSASVRFASVRSAPVRFAKIRYASVRLALVRLALVRLAKVRFPKVKFAPVRFAPVRFARTNLTWVKVQFERSTFGPGLAAQLTAVFAAMRAPEAVAAAVSIAEERTIAPATKPRTRECESFSLRLLSAVRADKKRKSQHVALGTGKEDSLMNKRPDR